MDRAKRPQDDLFEYSNGTWLRNVPIPPDRSSYGGQQIAQELCIQQEQKLLAAIGQPRDPETRKLGNLYLSFMDEARIEREGARPLAGEMQRIAQVKSYRDLCPLIGHFNRIGVTTPIYSYVSPDSKRSSHYAFWLNQSGMGLPDRDYYLSDDPKLVDFRAKYRSHIEATLHLLGDRQAAKEAGDIFNLETDLARIHWAPVDSRNPQKTYNPETLSGLIQLAPGIDWKGYLGSEGLPKPLPTMIVRQPDYFRRLSGLLQTVPLETWKEYFRFWLISSCSPYLSKAFVDEDFAFNEGVLQGTPHVPERWKRGCQLIDQSMGDVFGKLYVAKYFPAESKVRIDELVHNLLKTYAKSIARLDWMSSATKVEALAKLHKIRVKVGYPDKWRDYGKLSISPTDLMGNVFRAQEFEADRKHAQLAGPIDRNEWEMTPQTVDAYYDPTKNEIGFPAAVLQKPWFNPEAEDAFNYGSIGATIGHEISHGFDNRGSQYDGDGNLRNWWTDGDRAKYKAKTDQLVREFNAFEPVPGFHVNGALTLSENIGDLAGLEIAYEAYVASFHGRIPPVIDGLTADQRFFIGYAQSFLGKRRESLLIAQLKSNAHAPEECRVNGIAAHMRAFYDAFHVKVGDKMYLPPEDRVTLW